jgi:hypothetical protein
MSLLFYIDPKNNSTILRPDCLKLKPELSVLDEKEMMLIILTFDYHSPYRQFPEPERKRKAMIHVYGENVSEKFDETTIKIAIEAYKALQWIPELEQVKVYQRKIDRLNQQLEGDDNYTADKKILETIRLFEEAIRDLEKRATDSMISKGQIKGGQELSFIEELMRSEKYFKSITEKRKDD